MLKGSSCAHEKKFATAYTQKIVKSGTVHIETRARNNMSPLEAAYFEYWDY